MKESQHHSLCQINKAFLDACKAGHLEIVKYLLASPDLTAHADIHARDDYAFFSACEAGHLHIVQYLLSSPDLGEHANIHGCNDQGLITACENGHLGVVQYLLTSPQWVDHSHTQQALKCSFQHAQCDIVQFILYDMKIQVAPDACDNMKPEKKQQLMHLVHQRNFFFKMAQALEEKPDTNAIPKI